MGTMQPGSLDEVKASHGFMTTAQLVKYAEIFDGLPDDGKVLMSKKAVVLAKVESDYGDDTQKKPTSAFKAASALIDSALTYGHKVVIKLDPNTKVSTFHTNHETNEFTVHARPILFGKLQKSKYGASGGYDILWSEPFPTTSTEVSYDGDGSVEDDDNYFKVVCSALDNAINSGFKIFIEHHDDIPVSTYYTEAQHEQITVRARPWLFKRLWKHYGGQPAANDITWSQPAYFVGGLNETKIPDHLDPELIDWMKGDVIAQPETIKLKGFDIGTQPDKVASVTAMFENGKLTFTDEVVLSVQPGAGKTEAPYAKPKSKNPATILQELLDASALDTTVMSEQQLKELAAYCEEPVAALPETDDKQEIIYLDAASYKLSANFKAFINVMNKHVEYGGQVPPPKGWYGKHQLSVKEDEHLKDPILIHGVMSLPTPMWEDFKLAIQPEKHKHHYGKVHDLMLNAAVKVLVSKSFSEWQEWYVLDNENAPTARALRIRAYAPLSPHNDESKQVRIEAYDPKTNYVYVSWYDRDQKMLFMSPELRYFLHHYIGEAHKPKYFHGGYIAPGTKLFGKDTGPEAHIPGGKAVNYQTNIHINAAGVTTPEQAKQIAKAIAGGMKDAKHKLLSNINAEVEAMTISAEQIADGTLKAEKISVASMGDLLLEDATFSGHLTADTYMIAGKQIPKWALDNSRFGLDPKDIAARRGRVRIADIAWQDPALFEIVLQLMTPVGSSFNEYNYTYTIEGWSPHFDVCEAETVAAYTVRLETHGDMLHAYMEKAGIQ